MDVEECESVLTLLSSMRVKVQSALETINNCNPALTPNTSVLIPVATEIPDKMEKNAPEDALTMSRDEVKAQREKKKAEKLAKKLQSKEKGKGNPSPNEETSEKNISKGAKTELQSKKEESGKDKKTEIGLLKDENVRKGEDQKMKKGEKLCEKGKLEDSGEKSKTQLKAERRAIQEAQRATKAAALQKENAENSKKSTDPNATLKGHQEKVKVISDDKNLNTTGGKSSLVSVLDKLSSSSLRPRGASKRHLSESKMQTLFDHLPQSGDNTSLFRSSQSHLDPAFITLGQKYANGIYTSSKERCIQFIFTLRDYIKVYRTPSGKDFKYALAQSLKANLEFLQKCRPFAVAMENAVEHFNHLLRGLQSQTELVLSEQEVKQMLDDELVRFVDERINRAKDAIVREGKRKIRNDDVLLIFGCSELVWSIINEAAEKNSFCLVIVRDISQSNDSVKDRILSCIEGFINKRKSLGDTNVSVDYIGITGLSNRIQTVTKVLLDAEGLLANGKVMARAGTSEIALMASEHNIPVLVCCETYKFCDKSPTDSFSLNELKNRTDQFESLDNYDGYLKTPELVYDITPSELVTAVITDVDMLPSTSVPVVLRVQENRSRHT